MVPLLSFGMVSGCIYNEKSIFLLQTDEAEKDALLEKKKDVVERFGLKLQ